MRLSLNLSRIIKILTAEVASISIFIKHH